MPQNDSKLWGQVVSRLLLQSPSHSLNFTPLVQYIALDGDSLSTEDLVNLGKGRYKIKVRGGGRGGQCLSAPAGHGRTSCAHSWPMLP